MSLRTLSGSGGGKSHHRKSLIALPFAINIDTLTAHWHEKLSAIQSAIECVAEIIEGTELRLENSS